VIRSRLAASLAAVLLLSGCGGDAEPAAAPVPTPASHAAASPSAAPTTSSPSPSPTPTMTRKKACQLAVEATVDWTHLVGRFAADPSMEDIGSSEVTALIDKISNAQPHLDEQTKYQALQMVYPLEQMRSVMATGENVNIKLEDGKDAIPKVMKGCRGKASLAGYESQWEG
jgi:hypothetical protein